MYNSHWIIDRSFLLHQSLHSSPMCQLFLSKMNNCFWKKKKTNCLFYSLKRKQFDIANDLLERLFCNKQSRLLYNKNMAIVLFGNFFKWIADDIRFPQLIENKTNSINKIAQMALNGTKRRFEEVSALIIFGHVEIPQSATHKKQTKWSCHAIELKCADDVTIVGIQCALFQCVIQSNKAIKQKEHYNLYAPKKKNLKKFQTVHSYSPHNQTTNMSTFSTFYIFSSSLFRCPFVGFWCVFVQIFTVCLFFSVEQKCRFV